MAKNWARTGKPEDYTAYESQVRAISDAVLRGEYTAEEGKLAKKTLADATFAPEQDLSQFETLLGKLEGSKMKQAEQANRARRGDIYSQGIAQMMSNF